MSVAFNSRSGALKEEGWNHLMDVEAKLKRGRAVWWTGAAAALLGLLYLLLLAVILGYVARESRPAALQPLPPPINKSLPHQCLQLQLSFSSVLQRQEALLKESTSLAKERDALRAEREHLRLDSTDLAKERDALRAEREQLRLDSTDLTKEIRTILQRQEVLLKSSMSLASERDAFREERKQLATNLTKVISSALQRQEELLKDSTSLARERDALRAERDQFRLDTTNLTREISAILQKQEELLQNSTSLARERDALRAERDQFRLDTTNLTMELALLQSRYDTAAAIREELEREVAQTIPEKECPQHWMKWKEKCYFVSLSGVTKSWKQSRRDCQERRSHLVKIETTEEQNFITSFYDRTWTGLSAMDSGGGWVWTDGTELAGQGFWQRNEPNNNDRTEECVEVSRSGGGWNDLSCRTSLSWVCELSP